MVDVLEDGDDAIIITDERSGDWFTFNDATSVSSQSGHVAIPSLYS